MLTKAIRWKLIFISFFFFSVSLFSDKLLAQVSLGYLKVLKDGKYSNTESSKEIDFVYQNSNDTALVRLRSLYKLDSVAGFGNSQSRVLNVLHWVHNTIKHDGMTESGIKRLNADTILSFVKKKRIGVSCGELATVLNDCYLALGWKSRKIYCFPKDSLRNDPDSHVINSVYLPVEQKWVMLDPTNDAYVMDETGSLLSIEEVRSRLISGEPLLVNPDANWNRRISQTKETYLLYYIAKNFYRLYTPVVSAYDYESSNLKKRKYVTLAPLGYKKPVTAYSNVLVTNPKIFWQAP